MIKNINLNKTKVIFKKLPEFLAERLFLTFLMLSILVFLIGGFVFYKYYYLIEKSTPEIKEIPLLINTEPYQEMLNFWDQRVKNFEGADLKQYKNPFQGLIK